jgi:hypothetical protein
MLKPLNYVEGIDSLNESRYLHASDFYKVVVFSFKVYAF